MQKSSCSRVWAPAANSRGHDGPELYQSAALLKFLLAD